MMLLYPVEVVSALSVRTVLWLSFWTALQAVFVDVSEENFLHSHPQTLKYSETMKQMLDFSVLLW
jgi:hypothetical protein